MWSGPVELETMVITWMVTGFHKTEPPVSADSSHGVGALNTSFIDNNAVQQLCNL